MAWCHQASSHYLSQGWSRSILPYSITRLQWVNAKWSLTLQINTKFSKSLWDNQNSLFHTYYLFNSLRPSDAIWRQWSWTTLAQVMACCLTAPSHYLNQCWLIIRGVLWHTSESSFAGIAQGIDSGYEFEKDILKNIFKSPRGQWVKLRQFVINWHIKSITCWAIYTVDHCYNNNIAMYKLWW